MEKNKIALRYRKILTYFKPKEMHKKFKVKILDMGVC
jgi:hypothetical protein